MYSLWIMNLLSGYKFFSFLGGNGFVYHPAQYPKPLYDASIAVFALSSLAVVALVLVPIHREQKRMVPLHAALPIVSVWLWLQPLLQPFGFQAWVVPIAHGAQYLYIAHKVEWNSAGGFDSLLKKQVEKNNNLRGPFFVGLSLLAVFIGYLSWQYCPLMLDLTYANKVVTANFFFVAAFLFISLHHYLIDTVVWKKDSHARDLLHQAQSGV